MRVQRIAISVLTDSNGDFTGYSEVVQGRILQVRYVPDGSSPLDTGADVTITGEQSGVSILAQSNIGTSAYTKAPRQATHDVAGAAALFAAGGTAVQSEVVVGQERIKLVIAQGGNAKAGVFQLYVG